MGNFFQRSLRAIFTSTSRRTSTLLVILVVIAAIPLTVFVAQQRQNLSSKAAWYGCSAWTQDCKTCGADSNHPNELWCDFKCTACGRENGGECGGKCGSSGPPSSTCTWGGWQRCGTPPTSKILCTTDACARCLVEQENGNDDKFFNIYKEQGGWNIEDCDTQTKILHNWCSVANPTKCNALKNGACAGQCGIWGCSGDPCSDCIIQKGPNDPYVNPDSSSLLVFYKKNNPEVDGHPRWNTNCGSGQIEIVNDWCTNLNPSHCESLKNNNNECAISCGRAAPTSAAPASTAGDTLLSFTLSLGGIGSGGNPNPVHTQKQFTVQLFNSSNTQVGSNRTGPLNFDSGSGTFKGNVSLGGGIASGNYSLKIKGDKYLRRRIPQIISITGGTTNQIPSATLIVGDINNDNKLDILDYNIFVSCYGNGTSYCGNNKDASDLDDNGRVDGSDYNLFIRSLSEQQGD